jgi:hypothetical protein
MKEGEKDIYRMAKSRERKTRDIIQVKYIKDETEWLLTKDEDIKNRWQEYFSKLFNEDSGSLSIELDISSDDPAGTSCVGFKNLRSKMPWKGWREERRWVWMGSLLKHGHVLKT